MRSSGRADSRRKIVSLNPRLREHDAAEIDRTLRHELARVTLSGHEGIITCAAYSRDGKLVVTGSLDGTARLWDTTTWKLKHVIKGHSKGVRDVAVSPDGSTSSASTTCACTI